uniref:histidine-rich glycoprotein isoform X2 n=1 Tax=Jaculus jaculus TaxID=51337 RepID=UPI001E1B0489|nr:histidine-rich glycoprotein isoform X2 [Jaculus jaculus]
MVQPGTGWMGTMKMLTAALLWVTLQPSSAVSPTDCDATGPVAEKALDLVNKGRRNGYLFQLLRVADAHLDTGSATVYYLALDVKESDCWILSMKPQDDCYSDVSRRPSDIVIGQCKVIATRYSNESQDLRVNDFNCTTSSVSSALSNTKDSPVLFDFFEDTEPYRKQAERALDKYKRENGDFTSFRVDQVERVIRARGGERTNYYLDFSVRNCSAHHFSKHYTVFGFCRADLSYEVGASDLETPKDIGINCEVFDFKEHRNISNVKPHWGQPHHSGSHKDSSAGKHPHKPSGSRGHHHPHKTHELGYSSPVAEEDNLGKPPFQQGTLPPLPQPGSRCHHPFFGTNETHRPHHNHSCREHHPHGHHPHGHHPHGHHPHGHHPHGHHPHGHKFHRHHPHGHHPHGHHPHGHHSHKHHPHGHYPHGHSPHGHDFYDYGPCDPPPNCQELDGQHHRGHGPPHDHSGERIPGRRHFPFHWRQIGYVYRLPPLRTGEVLPLPEANFPIFSQPNCNKPPTVKIQPFPQSASKSCPGKFQSEFPQVFKFFAYPFPK